MPISRSAADQVGNHAIDPQAGESSASAANTQSTIIDTRRAARESAMISSIVCALKHNLLAVDFFQHFSNVCCGCLCIAVDAH